jgi:hypothetical protein
VPGVPELLDFLTVLAQESRTAARDYTESVQLPGLQLLG